MGIACYLINYHHVQIFKGIELQEKILGSRFEYLKNLST